jgi:hypothetical protein
MTKQGKYLYGYDRAGYVVVRANSREEADAKVSGEVPADYDDVCVMTTDPKGRALLVKEKEI